MFWNGALRTFRPTLVIANPEIGKQSNTAQHVLMIARTAADCNNRAHAQ